MRRRPLGVARVDRDLDRSEGGEVFAKGVAKGYLIGASQEPSRRNTVALAVDGEIATTPYDQSISIASDSDRLRILADLGA